MRAVIFTLLGTLLAIGLIGCSSAAATKQEKGKWKADPITHELLREREESASQLLQIERRKREIGRSRLEDVISAAVRLRDARLELGTQPETTIRGEHLAFMRELEHEAKKMVGFPEAVDSLIELARYWRLNAEIELIRSRARSPVY